MIKNQIPRKILNRKESYSTIILSHIQKKIVGGISNNLNQIPRFNSNWKVCVSLSSNNT